MSGFAFEKHKGYCVVQFESGLPDMSWTDVEKQTTEVVNSLKEARANRVLIDLSPMEMIQSGLVAALVRIWKATEEQKNRRVVIVAPTEIVREVVRSAGLLKLFSVADTREEGAYDLGVSQGALREQRERRVIAWVAFPAAVISVIALAPLYQQNDEMVKARAELIAGFVSVFSCITGLMSMVRDSGWRRGLGVLTLPVAVGVLGILCLNRFGSGLPGRELFEGSSSAVEGGAPSDAGDDESSNGATGESEASEDAPGPADGGGAGSQPFGAGSLLEGFPMPNNPVPGAIPPQPELSPDPDEQSHE